MSVLTVWTMEKIGAQCRCTTGSKLPTASCQSTRSLWAPKLSRCRGLTMLWYYTRLSVVSGTEILRRSQTLAVGHLLHS